MALGVAARHKGFAGDGAWWRHMGVGGGLPPGGGRGRLSPFSRAPPPAVTGTPDGPTGEEGGINAERVRRLVLGNPLGHMYMFVV